MKKISAIIAVLSVASIFAFAGCQKQEAPKPTVESAVTSTEPATAPAAEPAATPEHK